MNNKPDITKLKRKSRYFRYSCLLITIVLAVTLVGLYICRPNRVNREHSDNVDKPFEYLTRRINVHCPGDRNLSAKKAQQDLDELEWLLENRYSYLKLKGVNYKAALDSIRNSLGAGISRGSLAMQLMKFIALFGDGHSRVGDPFLTWMCTKYLPFLTEPSGDKLVVFKEDRSDFLDPNYPFLQALDGLPADTWLKASGRFTTKGSLQFFRYHSIRNLRYIDCWRKELNLNNSDSIQIELASADGLKTKHIELSLTNKGPIYGFWPRSETEIKKREDIRVESRILPQNIGYLRILACLDEPKFLDGLIDAMNQLKNTDGLIIDIRHSNGGTHAPLKVLFPFFMTQDDSPHIVNISAYRLGTKDRKEQFEGRYLYPASSPHFSQTEKDAIAHFATKFQPEWRPPPEQFSQWHYFIISPSTDSRYYHYDKPVIILMDQWNFSALDIFLGAFKGWRNVTLMGQPSGGGSGCRVSYRLRNSKIQIRLSSMASFRPNGKLYDGNGIQPDIVIESIPTDFTGKTDSILQAAIEKLQKKDI